MEYDILNRIRSVEKKIETSLSNEDFLSIPALSLDLEELIKEFAATIKYDKDFKYNSKELDRISLKLEFFKNQTAKMFKNYQSKVSAQTKMHLAYKKYSK